jgi:hypothetical protein
MNFGECAGRLAGPVARLMGWSPDQFWASTPAEVQCALTLEGAPAETVSRDEVARLAALHPDKE